MDATPTSSLIILPSAERVKLTPTWSQEQRDFRNWLDVMLAGQEEAKNQVTEVLGRIRNPLREMDKPIDSFILAGPSTTGKTEIFKLLVEWVNGDSKHMMFFSGSNYIEQHQIQRLIGAPHGYHGYVAEDATKKDKGVKDSSAELAQHNVDNSVIGAKSNIRFMLFDEWEKFHYAFNMFMLQPLREGKSSINNGAEIDFSNVVIGFTSNIGADELERSAKGYGFTRNNSKEELDTEKVRDVIVPELVRRTAQEFRNRINRIIVFRPLKLSETLALVEIQLEKLRGRIFKLKPEEQFFFTATDAAKQFLLRDTDPVEGKDTKNRIPKLQERIDRYVVAPLGQLMRSLDFSRDGAGERVRSIKAGDKITIDYAEGSSGMSFDVIKFEGIDSLALNLPGAAGGGADAVSMKADSSASTNGKTSETESATAKAKSTKPRRKRKPAEKRIVFSINAEFGDGVHMGKKTILALIEESMGAIAMRADQTDYTNGSFSCEVEAKYSQMVEFKEKLVAKHSDVRVFATL